LKISWHRNVSFKKKIAISKIVNGNNFKQKQFRAKYFTYRYLKNTARKSKRMPSKRRGECLRQKESRIAVFQREHWRWCNNIRHCKGVIYNVRLKTYSPITIFIFSKCAWLAVAHLQIWRPRHSVCQRPQFQTT